VENYASNRVPCTDAARAGRPAISPGMSTITPITQEPPTDAVERRSETGVFYTREMWASLAISMMWVAVALASIFGPNFVSTTPGGDSTTIPSGIAVGLFASIASWLVAKHGFGHRDPD
jgi:hypothetical protein